MAQSISLSPHRGHAAAPRAGFKARDGGRAARRARRMKEADILLAARGAPARADALARIGRSPQVQVDRLGLACGVRETGKSWKFPWQLRPGMGSNHFCVVFAEPVLQTIVRWNKNGRPMSFRRRLESTTRNRCKTP